MVRNDIISNMKKTILERCRERIEDAKCKPKEIVKEEICGVTSILKKKHGL